MHKRKLVHAFFIPVREIHYRSPDYFSKDRPIKYKNSKQVMI